jgi:D-glycero-alpha-D-manno-heptose-7-phosphate kinase
MMQVQTHAPCRVDMAGGTLDIWPLYLYHANAVTVNFAVNLNTSCLIETREDRRIHLRSVDLNVEESFASLADLRAARRPRNTLAAWVVKYFAPEMGLNVTTNSEAPAGAGISGSSSLLISTVSAFNKLLNTGHDIETVREIAQNIEAQIIRVPTGCQDYYPAMYGGVSAIELGVAGVRRKSIPVDLAELNRRFVLAYTGKPRNSGINNWEVTKSHIDGDRTVHKNFERIAAISHAMRGALEASQWDEAARLLGEEWAHRRKNAPGITTPLIDRLVSVTRRSGALAAKVCGAGGGGCVVFLAEPEARERVAAAIEREGAQVLNVTVAPKGVRIKVKA